ncbi:MAG: hypothetical protein CMH52_12050 [Myxococcales bacterium]|nr:hypothetical protein [Myxococcales bacterium]
MTRRLALSTLILLAVACDDPSESGVIIVPDSAQDQSTGLDSTPVDRGILTDQATQDQGQNLDALVDAETDMFIAKACNDEIDNDSDDLIDYPLDPGCSSLEDDNELDPDLSACSDGQDNDDDGRTDFPDDPGCSSSGDVNESNLCSDAFEFKDLTGHARYAGTTDGANSTLNVCRNNAAPELIFQFTIRDQVERVRVDTAGSSFDTLLGIWRECDDPTTEIVCNDDVAFDTRTSEVVLETPTPGDYYILVDGHGSESGPFELNIRGELGLNQPCSSDDQGLNWIVCGLGLACRDGRCQTAQCSDGLDNDGNGRFDYPNDPGCDSEDDNQEQLAGNIPQCADGADNDFDGRVDYPNDPDCTSAADDDESSPPACRDERDNDGDGLIDLDDPGCNGDPDRFSEFNLPACRNNIDDDDDGLTDYPNDPGCAERNDPDETDPDPLPQCADGVDNDEDGFTDFPDDAESCLSAADDTENDPCLNLEPREVTGLSRTRGNTAEKPNNFEGSCRQPSGREDVLLWRVDDGFALQGLILDTRDSDFDTHIYVRSSCRADSEIACDDNGGGGFTSRIELGPQPVGTELYIFIDGSPDSSGIWRIRLTGKLAEGQDCGSRRDYVCGDGLTCEDTPNGQRCARARCGDEIDNDNDGFIDYPNDPGCDTPNDMDEADPAVRPACSNGIDDDGDGLTDFGQDDRCDSAADPFEGPDCADGIDNDEDGATDYDRDRDGNSGPNRDAECVCANDPLEADQPDCSDHCDNDGDGLIDLADPGCQDDPDRNSEFNAPQCRDFIDNNQDGRTDYPNDPSCNFQDAPLERDVGDNPDCLDEVDNDGDGRIDHPNDPGCTSAADEDERATCDSDLTVFARDGSMMGDTSTGMAENQGTCGFDGGSPETIYRLPVPYPARVVIDTFGSSFNTVLYARSSCEAEIICPDPEMEPPIDAGVAPDAQVERDIDLGIDGGGLDDAMADAGTPTDFGLDALPDSPDADVDVDDAGRSPNNDMGLDMSVDMALDMSVDMAVDMALDVSVDMAVDMALDMRVDMAVDMALDMTVDAGVEPVGFNEPDLAPIPCLPGPTQLACNDNSNGIQSQIDFAWNGGDIFVFVDGFGRLFGRYRVQASATYPRGGQCGPILFDYASCEAGTQCQLDIGRGISTCQ